MGALHPCHTCHLLQIFYKFNKKKAFSKDYKKTFISSLWAPCVLHTTSGNCTAVLLAKKKYVILILPSLDLKAKHFFNFSYFM